MLAPPTKTFPVEGNERNARRTQPIGSWRRDGPSAEAVLLVGAPFQHPWRHLLIAVTRSPGRGDEETLGEEMLEEEAFCGALEGSECGGWRCPRGPYRLPSTQSASSSHYSGGPWLEEETCRRPAPVRHNTLLRAVYMSTKPLINFSGNEWGNWRSEETQSQRPLRRPWSRGARRYKD